MEHLDHFMGLWHVLSADRWKNYLNKGFFFFLIHAKIVWL